MLVSIGVELRGARTCRVQAQRGLRCDIYNCDYLLEILVRFHGYRSDFLVTEIGTVRPPGLGRPYVELCESGRNLSEKICRASLLRDYSKYTCWQ